MKETEVLNYSKFSTGKRVSCGSQEGPEILGRQAPNILDVI
jgi:hypothetical protein